jgi:adenylate cyclase class 2
MASPPEKTTTRPAPTADHARVAEATETQAPDTQPPVERELKFAEVEHDSLRDRLIDLEAERVVPSSLEENFLFDRGQELLEQGCVLRLRMEPRGAWLTYKGPAEFEGRTKVRVEHEISVGDGDTTRSLLEAIGFQQARSYQKRREIWRVGGVTVALDHTPIGDFAEFEGEAAEALAKRFGFDPETAERRSYLRLYEDYLREHPEAPRNMTFES